jgi:hypothetical protein
MNPDAGRGNWLLVTLRTQCGKELPLVVDTGTPVTVLDSSIEPELGNRVGTGDFSFPIGKRESGVHPAPQLYLASALLPKLPFICTSDLKELPSLSGHPIKGVLGMDILNHFCVQLDFQAGTIRFLNSNEVDVATLGQPFPLTFLSQGNVTVTLFGRPIVTQLRCPYISAESLIGGGTNVLIDTGHNRDGALDAALFQRGLQDHKLRGQGDDDDSEERYGASLQQGVWNGNTYTNLLIGMDKNSLGLRFLARHLVTFDFPNKILYLKRLRGDPLPSPDAESAANFLTRLKQREHVPGWPKNEHASISLEGHPGSETYVFRKERALSTCHYRIGRTSKTAPWQLQKAWRTDERDALVEKFPLP